MENFFDRCWLGDRYCIWHYMYMRGLVNTVLVQQYLIVSYYGTFTDRGILFDFDSNKSKCKSWKLLELRMMLIGGYAGEAGYAMAPAFISVWPDGYIIYEIFKGEASNPMRIVVMLPAAGLKHSCDCYLQAIYPIGYPRIHGRWNE